MLNLNFLLTLGITVPAAWELQHQLHIGFLNIRTGPEIEVTNRGLYRKKVINLPEVFSFSKKLHCNA